MLNTKRTLVKSLFQCAVFSFAKQSPKQTRKEEIIKEKSTIDVPVEIDFGPFEEANRKIFKAFEVEIKSIKIGKLTPDLFKNIFLSNSNTGPTIYDSAQILPVNATTVTITPYDGSQKKSIYQALEKDKMHEFQISQEPNDKFVVTVSPGVTSEKKKRMLKMIHEVAEKYKEKLRDARHDFIKSQEKYQKFLSKDVVKKTKDEISEIFEKCTEEFEKLIKAKEKEFK